MRTSSPSIKVSERRLKRRPDSNSGNNQKKIRKLTYTGRLDYDGPISFALSPNQRKRPIVFHSLPHSADTSYSSSSLVSSSSSVQVMRDCKRSSVSQPPEPFEVASGSRRPKPIFPSTIPSPTKSEPKIPNESVSKPEPSACSSSVRIPASSYNSPPRSPKVTTQGTPPPVDIIKKTAQTGSCKDVGKQFIDADGTRRFAKPAFPILNNNNVTMGNVNPIKLLKDVPKNAYCEMKLGEILNRHLKEEPIFITLGANTFQINILPVELNDSFHFVQKLASPDSFSEEKKYQLSREILKELLPALWKKGLYIVPDIRPSNFFVKKTGDNKFSVDIFDWAYPNHLLADEGVFYWLGTHLSTVKMVDEEKNELKNKLSEYVDNNKKINTSASIQSSQSSESLNERVFKQFQTEANHEWGSFLTTHQSALNGLKNYIRDRNENERFKRKLQGIFKKIKHPHILDYLKSSENLSEFFPDQAASSSSQSI